MSKKYSAEDKASALAVVQTTNVRKSARLLGIPRSTLKNWTKGEGVTGVTQEMVAEKTKALSDRFEQIANTLTGALLDKEKIAKATLSQVAVAAGIAVDKMNILRNSPTRIVQTVTDRNERQRYETAVKDLIKVAKKEDITIEPAEAIELLESHLPNIRTVLEVH